MIPHHVITVLVTITLVEMMVFIGLQVSVDDVVSAAMNWRRLARALVANYLIVPAAALVLLEIFADPQDPNSRNLAVGLLVVAVFPGASFGPPFTTFARGDLSLSVGLMVLLAASSALLGPVLLRLLLHLTSVNESLTIDVPRVIGILAMTQLLPLGAGIGVRRFFPGAATRLSHPLELLGKLLNGAAIGCILFNHLHQGGQLHWVDVYVMGSLLIVSLLAGYVSGGPESAGRKAVALTTSLRNIGVGVVVASSHEVGPAPLAAVIGYAIVEMTGSLLLALWWGRGQARAPRSLIPSSGVRGGREI